MRPRCGAGPGGRRLARRGRACAAAAALVLLSGCGREESPPLSPQAALAPPVAEVHPAARSTGVPYDTDVWVRFSVPLVAATVNERTVFLKVDTARIPMTPTYDDATRTIRLVPDQPLALIRTHTVEITPGVATAGGSLGQTYFWQFRTTGLRRLEHPLPEAGASGQSPYVMLRWAGTEPAAGDIAYQVYVGDDSLAVAARGFPATSLSTQPFLLPRARWGSGVRRYWAVDAENRTTGERTAGPVWSFGTLPAQTPVDSLVVPVAGWGYYTSVLGRMVCVGNSFASGPSFNNGIRWQLYPGVGDLKLARARLVVYANVPASTNLAAYRPELVGIGEPWSPCEIGPITPRPDGTGPLASGFRIGPSPRLGYEADAFTAHLEAAARFGYGYGYSLRTFLNLTYLSPETPQAGFEPVLTLHYYRTAPAQATRGPASR